MKILRGEKKLKKGLVRVKMEIDDNGRIESITITGDFFMIPEDSLWKLEEELIGAKLEREEILKIIKKVFEETRATLVGSSPEELTEAILEVEEI
ncbi:MAG: lipoate protein ligase C-terminal domain-containing protein [Fervidicoccaceae archaeon]